MPQSVVEQSVERMPDPDRVHRTMASAQRSRHRARPGKKATVATLTMTTCHPEFSARERYIVRADLDATYPRAKGVPADLLQKGE